MREKFDTKFHPGLTPKEKNVDFNSVYKTPFEEFAVGYN